MRSYLFLQACSFVLFLPAALGSTTVLMDSSGKLQPMSGDTTDGIVTVVTSPGTDSTLVPATSEILSSVDGTLVCKGATLGTLAHEEAAMTSLALCGAISDCVVIDGITLGDTSELRNTRHARTLTALFRARSMVMDAGAEFTKQTLLLAVTGGSNLDENVIAGEVECLFKAATAGKSLCLEDLFVVKILAIESSSPSKILGIATDSAKASTKGSRPFASTLQNALKQVKEGGVATASGLDPPHIASAFVSVSNASVKQSRQVRAKIAAWKGRVARGMIVDGYGRDATALRKRALLAFDADTLSAAGLPMVSAYRLEMRLQLQQLLDTSITQIFNGQVANLEKSTLKRFTAALLKTVNSSESVESTLDSNTATLRKEALIFENVLEDLAVASLGLTKDKATLEIGAKLNEALTSFPDSAAAKLKRSQQVEKVVNKDKEPGERSLGFGLDIVAMLRPDGFGSLQGYAGYNLPGGNSVTFGVHNDADDPQVISQFGGVRPPLLRVQPKLKINVEM